MYIIDKIINIFNKNLIKEEKHIEKHIKHIDIKIGDKLVCKKNISIFIEGENCVVNNIYHDINNI